MQPRSRHVVRWRIWVRLWAKVSYIRCLVGRQNIVTTPTLHAFFLISVLHSPIDFTVPYNSSVSSLTQRVFSVILSSLFDLRLRLSIGYSLEIPNYCLLLFTRAYRHFSDSTSTTFPQWAVVVITKASNDINFLTYQPRDQYAKGHSRNFTTQTSQIAIMGRGGYN
jgi:hypothetical protein